MVSLEVADPDGRRAGRGGAGALGGGTGAGLAERERSAPLAEALSRLAGALFAAGPAAVARLGAAGRLDLPSGRLAPRALALDCPFERRLEELTPELPDPAD